MSNDDHENPHLPVRERFEALLRRAAETNATGVHLLPDLPPRLRTADGLEPQGEPVSAAQLNELATSLFSERHRERQAEAGSVSVNIPLAEQPAKGLPRCARVTLATSRGRYTIAAGMRRATIPTFDELRMPAVVRDLLSVSHGLIVVAGPHGSGKTTTLYALVEWLNQNRPIHIVTVEDPIEFVLTPQAALVQQREVGLDVPDAAAGIASAIEQDLDALMIGGLADLEALSAALHAAETGHLVIVQLHADDARDALERIVHAAPEPLRASIRRGLSESIQGVVAQRLQPKPKAGRAAVYEVLVPDEALRVALATGGALGALDGDARSVTRADSLASLRAAGVIE